MHFLIGDKEINTTSQRYVLISVATPSLQGLNGFALHDISKTQFVSKHRQIQPGTWRCQIFSGHRGWHDVRYVPQLYNTTNSI